MKSKIQNVQNSFKLNTGKNLMLVFFASIFLLASCNNSKVVADNEKLMRGDWTVTNVSVNGINQSYVDITVFDEAKTQCYEGSTWHLIQNNATGYYYLAEGPDCPSNALATKIKWFITEEGGQYYFNFKKVYEGEKPKNVVDGYKMRVASNTGSTIVLVQDLMFEGKPISVNYTFQKNS